MAKLYVTRVQPPPPTVVEEVTLHVSPTEFKLMRYALGVVSRDKVREALGVDAALVLFDLYDQLAATDVEPQSVH